MRVAIDGFNLSMVDGTGVANYGASMAAVLHQAGHEVEGVFGLDAGKRPETREILFFDRFGHGHRLKPGTMARRVGLTALRPFSTSQLMQVPLTDTVDKRSFGFRLPDFSALWTSPLLFEVAWARFAYFGLTTTISVPNPPKVMHWTYPLPIRMAGARNIYTIHDLVPLKLPQATLDNKLFYHKLIAKCLALGDHIITVSEASRRDIREIFPDTDKSKITNTYQSSPIPSDIINALPSADASFILHTFGLKEKGFYLFFGAVDPKKNIGRIVDGYLASESKLPLVIVSSRDWGMSNETRMLNADGRVYGRNLGKRIVQLQYLPRLTLFRLIRSAKAVLFPSLYEGFGLPVLESMQLGTPTITSTTSSLPEVAGSAALLVDPYQTSAIAAAIRRLEDEPGLGEKLSKAGLAQAQNFSDARFSERIEDVYRKLGLA
ncbi:glycosyltransferase family 1 protein [Sphingomonas sp. 28-63-12]|uniref:glycosyltransferase family 4 protein n=1 Tax=Sphingomonas sp. 28-63-12 TaxID=1970434 RepID=UPI000BD21479|nr:MAG: glycosyl transferase family 1 [Sphingomonas sp. 28-63-12]